MPSVAIDRISVFDLRFPLPHGVGSDAVHVDPEYCLAVTRLETAKSSLAGTGFALTLGEGNRLVCDAVRLLAQSLQDMPVEDLMADFGRHLRHMADDRFLRWLGPHKGVVHLALASIANACFDLWAKTRGLPLWRLLLDLSPEQMVKLLDLSYLDEVMDEQAALELLKHESPHREARLKILQSGYPAYDTSVGWMAWNDDKVRELTRCSMDLGFSAFKLKVGSLDRARDLRRAAAVRETAGQSATVMFDANQQWTFPVAREMCAKLSVLAPLWIEEPTHPDDLAVHARLAHEIAPVKIAAGEHIPNRVIFKNFMQASALYFVQADCTRLAGVSEFLTVSLLARQFRLPVVPHAGDMGQVHQHLALFNHIALGHEALFLEYIPHLRPHFVHPAEVAGGRYRTPQEPGASTDLRNLTTQRA
jgi:L-fuconate dehydratase